MDIYLVDLFAKNAILCGHMHTVADGSEFEEYTGEEVRLHLCNSIKGNGVFYSAAKRIGCTDIIRVYNDRDYEIMEGPSHGVTDGNFRFYCEDDLPKTFTIKEI